MDWVYKIHLLFTLYMLGLIWFVQVVHYPLMGTAGLLGLWGSTFFIQVPLHNALSQAFDPKNHARLVQTNWIRTIIWSLRALLLLSWV